MSDLITVYQYFTLEQWKAMAQAIRLDFRLSQIEKDVILTKFPSVVL